MLEAQPPIACYMRSDTEVLMARVSGLGWLGILRLLTVTYGWRLSTLRRLGTSLCSCPTAAKGLFSTGKYTTIRSCGANSRVWEWPFVPSPIPRLFCGRSRRGARKRSRSSTACGQSPGSTSANARCCFLATDLGLSRSIYVGVRERSSLLLKLRRFSREVGNASESTRKLWDGFFSKAC